MSESNWFKKHTDTVIVLAGILAAVLWINKNINDLDKRLVRIETVLIMKNIMSQEMCAKNEKINSKLGEGK